MGETFDETAMRQAIRMSLRGMAETTAAQLRAMAHDPVIIGVSAQEALLAAARTVISTNEKTWGKETPQ